MSDGGAYRDEETLRRLYVVERMSMGQMAERFDVAVSTVHKWMKHHEIERRERTTRIEPGTHRDEGTLQRLYHDEGLTLDQVAERLECGVTTIKDWMNRYDIERRDPIAASKAASRVPYATYLTKPSGYEAWAARHDGDMDWVYVHRLLAVAKYGFDAVCDSVVHHRNGIKWDNRPSNVELMDRADHGRLHGEGELVGTGDDAHYETETTLTAWADRDRLDDGFRMFVDEGDHDPDAGAGGAAGEVAADA